MTMTRQKLLGFVFALALSSPVAEARSTDLRPPQEKLLEGVSIDQRLGATVPMDLNFKDETGRDVRLRDYFGKRTVVLAMVYYECPMLCKMVLNGITRSMKMVTLDPGKDFEIVLVSIDPNETPELAAAKKKTSMETYRREHAEVGWHFLTGDEANIRGLAEAVGFRYTYDPQTKQYAHAAGLMVATPEGRLSHYFYGIEYPTRDLRLAIVEASTETIGTPVDRVLLYCFHYDPMTGKYGLVIMRVLRILGIATVLALAGGIAWMIRRERRRKEPAPLGTA
jgi:protein SCO1/2